MTRRVSDAAVALPNERGRADAPDAAAPVEAVLLDIDGTLLDSNDAHAQAWSDALREAGFDIGSEKVLPLVGMGGDKLLPALTGIDVDSEEGKRLVARRMEIFEKGYLPTIRPFPKARALLERMRRDGLRLVVATSANERELRGLLTTLGAAWLVDDETSSSDASDSKPDPDIVRVAVGKSGVGPARCVMLGDTPYDVEAATRAGVRTVAVRCGGWGDDGLRGAIAVYDDPQELLAKYDETVFGGAGHADGGTPATEAPPPGERRGESERRRGTSMEDRGDAHSA